MSQSKLDRERMRRAVASVLFNPAYSEAAMTAAGLTLGQRLPGSVHIPGASEAVASVLADKAFQQGLQEMARRAALQFERW